MMTFDQYRQFCSDLIESGARSVTVRDAVASKNQTALMLKHDVEANIEKAVECARIEADLGHRCTYYLHGFFAVEENREHFDEILGSGHEIGYHYDVLDEADGDYEIAEQQFDDYLAEFQKLGAQIETICPHGNPLKKRVGWRSNKDFFKKSDIVARNSQLFDIVNQSQEVFDNFEYYSDAGFQLKMVGDIRGNDASNESAISDGQAVSRRELVNKCREPNGAIIISIHPHRLEAGIARLKLRTSTFRAARATARFISKSALIRRMISPLYRMTKRI